MEATVSNLSITKSTAVFSSVTRGVGLAVLAQQTPMMELDSALLRVVFIGLAALTVPHMISWTACSTEGRQQHEERDNLVLS